MSFNLSIAAAAPRLSTESLAGPGLHASFDGDWCGTKGPRPPIPHALEVALRNSRFEQVALNPQPLPPGPDGRVFNQAGRALLDGDWCGTVPKRFPPPPPPIADLIGRALGQI